MTTMLVDTPKKVVVALTDSKPGDVVVVEGSLNMTGEVWKARKAGHDCALTVPVGVSLHGGKGSALQCDELDAAPFVRLLGGNVVRCLDFEGPDRATWEEVGTYIVPFSQGIEVAAKAQDVFVLGCTLHGWSHAGIIARKDSRVVVQSCEIAHCRRYGLGYGVAVDGGQVSVRGGQIDWCSHAISSTGVPGSGYEVIGATLGPHTASAVLDVHKDKPIGASGDFFRAVGNTIRVDNPYRNGIYVVGKVKAKGIEIRDNWFPDYPVTSDAAIRLGDGQVGPVVERNRIGDNDATRTEA